MSKKFFTVALMSCMLVLYASICSAAGTFQTIYTAANFTETLKNNEAVEETFNTNDGALKFQLRKLWTSDSDKMMHIIAWLNDKKIYDEHFPQITYGYTFRAIKNTADNRQFYVVQSVERALLIGYSAINNKMEIYIDSQNYYHDFEAYPYIITTKTGDLVLAFEQINTGNRVPIRTRYRFTWDNSKNWFAYSNLGRVNHSIAQDMQ